MNRTRIALLGALAVLVAVWASTASLPSAPADAPPRDASSASREQPAPMLFDVAEASRVLKARQQDAPSPRSGRNPFELAPTAPPRPAVAPAPAAPVEAPAPAVPAAPLLTLSGVAERTEAGSKVRTAVISGFGRLFFVKAGDTVSSRYTVTAIGADAVELVDTVTGQTLRLGLP